MKKRAYYVVLTEGRYYLVSLNKAIRGEGLEGGAYSEDRKRAKRFYHHATARVAAEQVYHGSWTKVSPDESRA